LEVVSLYVEVVEVDVVVVLVVAEGLTVVGTLT
jgi:hypothetical protein